MVSLVLGWLVGGLNQWSTRADGAHFVVRRGHLAIAGCQGIGQQLELSLCFLQLDLKQIGPAWWVPNESDVV